MSSRTIAATVVEETMIGVESLADVPEQEGKL